MVDDEIVILNGRSSFVKSILLFPEDSLRITLL